MEKIKKETIKVVFFAKFISDTDIETDSVQQFSSNRKNLGDSSSKNAVSTGKKVRRNSPCPCGSGKKFKHCCGAI